MADFSPHRQYLHPADLAERLGVDVRTVRNMSKAGELPPPVRITRQRIGWPVEAWDAWRASRQAVA